MIKIIICILVLSLNVSSASKSDIVKIVPDVPVQTTLLELFKEYGYDKPISQETKKNLKSNLLHHLRKIVQNEKIYHSYALFILSQLNEGRSDHIINQLFFSQDWKKIYDALKAVYFFGYPDDLTPLIINQIKKNHWFPGIRLVSEKIVDSLDKEKLTFSEKVDGWGSIENQFYEYLKNCKIDNRSSSLKSLHQQVDQIKDEMLVKLLLKNNIQIKKLRNTYLDIVGYRLLSALSNQLIIVNSDYEITILNTGSLISKYIIEKNGNIFVVLNGYDSIGHDQLFLLQNQSENFMLDYLFTFVYIIEDIKQKGNEIIFHGSNWNMSLNPFNLTISPLNVCGEDTDIKIGL